MFIAEVHCKFIAGQWHRACYVVSFSAVGDYKISPFKDSIIRGRYVNSKTKLVDEEKLLNVMEDKDNLRKLHPWIFTKTKGGNPKRKHVVQCEMIGALMRHIPLPSPSVKNGADQQDS